jgi:hypothetical protein
MSDQTPEYVPPPRSSGAGIVIGILVAVFLLVAVCGVALLGFGWFAYRAVDVQMPPPVPQPIVEEAPAIGPMVEAEATRGPGVTSP